MQQVAVRRPVSGPAGVISKSLDAGLEIEKSRLDQEYDADVIREFGRLLKQRAIRTTDEGQRRFSDPAYAVPLRNMYLVHKGEGADGTAQDILSYLESFANSLAEYDNSLQPEKKAELVRLCADLHQFLSDELRDNQESGYYGWWN